MNSLSSAYTVLSVAIALSSTFALADQESVQFKGQVDKGLTNIQAVMFAQADNDTNILCNTFNFDGAKIPRTSMHTVSATVDAQGAYQMTVPRVQNVTLDLFNVCDVTPDSIMFTVYDPALPSHAQMVDKSDGSISFETHAPDPSDGSDITSVAAINQITWNPKYIAPSGGDSGFWYLSASPNGTLPPGSIIFVPVTPVGSPVPTYQIDFKLGAAPTP